MRFYLQPLLLEKCDRGHKVGAGAEVEVKVKVEVKVEVKVGVEADLGTVEISINI
jgi:hypothetical protein